MNRWIATTLTLCLAAPGLATMAAVNVNTAQQSELERTKGLDRS